MGNIIESIEKEALFKIGYGLYVAITNDGERDNAAIINTVCQLTDDKVAVTVNRKNYTCETIKKTGKLNVSCLCETTPFSLFEDFGFRSGRDVDKLSGYDTFRSANGLCVLIDHTNAFMSLEVSETVELDTHVLFICTLTEAKVISDADTLTYAYYHKNIKPKPTAKKAGGYVCKICGYVYEGETLPEDFVCPLCKHPASDFEPLG